MKKTKKTSMQIVMALLLATALIWVSSCKKSPSQQGPSKQESQAKKVEKQPAESQTKTLPAEKKTAQAPAKEESKPAPKAESKPAAKPQPKPAPEKKQPEKTASATSGHPAGWAPLPLVLPKPMFEGTPTNINVPNLEKPLGKPRPPFYAPKGCKNVALHKPVSSTDEEPIIGEIDMITDGDKAAADGSYVELGPFKQHVTIDLEGEYNIYAVLVWHFHKQARVYFDVIVQVSDDPDFITNVHTIFNNDNDNSSGLGIGKDKNYIETSEGKLIDAKGVKGRYVRLYSNGNNGNELNHYIEVEVWGVPAK